jgi:hypothetical protein
MLSVNSLINVEVSLAAAGAQGQDTSDLLLLTGNTVIDLTTRYRIYTSLSAVGIDFGTDSLEYAAALLHFSQVPQPPRLLIARWAQAAAAGQLIGGALTAQQQAIANFVAVGADGGFSVAIDGNAVQHITGINLSEVANLNAVAAAITTALAGSATVTWNPVYGQFTATSATTGAASAVSFFSAAVGVGVTDITPLLGLASTFSGSMEVQGAAAETALAAATLMDASFGGKWYALVMPSITADADHVAVAQFIEATKRKHFYGVTTGEAGCLVPTSTTDLGYLLAQANVKKTAWMYSSSSAVAIVSLLARILFVDYTAQNTVINLMYKNCPGLTAENLSDTANAALAAKNGNVFQELDNGVSIITTGTTATTNVFIDTIIGADVFAVTLQVGIFNALYTSTTGIAQDDSGMHILVAAAQAVCDQFLANGYLGPNDWTNAGFGTLNSSGRTGDYLEDGYYVYAQPVVTQAKAQRAARIAVPIQIAATCAGAINTANVLVTLVP